MNTVFYFRRSYSGNVYTMCLPGIIMDVEVAQCGWEKDDKVLKKGNPCSIKSWSVNVPFSEDPEEHDKIKNELFGIICQKFKELHSVGGMRPGESLEMPLELNESLV